MMKWVNTGEQADKEKFATMNINQEESVCTGSPGRYACAVYITNKHPPPKSKFKIQKIIILSIFHIGVKHGLSMWGRNRG